MKYFWIFFIFSLCLFLESSILMLPLVLLIILLFGVLYKQTWIFLAAFLLGIFLDILTFGRIGESSIFFLSVMGIVFLYERKFEIQSIPFISIFSFISTLIYGCIFASSFFFWQAIVMAILGGGMFYVLSIFNINRSYPIGMKS